MYADESVGPFLPVSYPKRTLCACAATVLYDLGHDAGADIMKGLHVLCVIIKDFGRNGSANVV